MAKKTAPESPAPRDPGAAWCEEVRHRLAAAEQALRDLAELTPPPSCGGLDELLALRLAQGLPYPRQPSSVTTQTYAVEAALHRLHDLAKRTTTAQARSLRWAEQQIERLALEGHPRLLHLADPRCAGALQLATLFTDARRTHGEDAVVVAYGLVSPTHPAHPTLAAIAARVAEGGFRLLQGSEPALVLGAPFHRDGRWRYLDEDAAVRETTRWVKKQADLREQERLERELATQSRMTAEQRRIAELEQRVASLEAEKSRSQVEG